MDRMAQFALQVAVHLCHDTCLRKDDRLRGIFRPQVSFRDGREWLKPCNKTP